MCIWTLCLPWITWSVLHQINSPRELISTRKTSHKHSKKDLNHLWLLSPGMQVNARSINAWSCCSVSTCPYSDRGYGELFSVSGCMLSQSVCVYVCTLPQSQCLCVSYPGFLCWVERRWRRQSWLVLMATARPLSASTSPLTRCYR